MKPPEENDVASEVDSLPDTTWPRLTKDQINAFPIGRYQGPVHVIKNATQVDKAIGVLEGETVLGFDTETRPSFRAGQQYLPAVLQLAGEKAAYVFQLRHCRFPERLRQLLSNPRIIKAGVALDFDVRELNRLTPFEPAGFVDVGEVPRKQGA